MVQLRSMPVLPRSRRLHSLAGALCLVLLAGCAAHSPFILKNTTDTDLATQTKYPSYDGKVFVTEQAVPANVKFDMVGTIDVGKIWYGSDKNVLASMAERARQIGANCVMNVKTWHQPSGFSWAAPHGSGQAVRIKNVNTLRELGIAGDWY